MNTNMYLTCKPKSFPHRPNTNNKDDYDDYDAVNLSYHSSVLFGLIFSTFNPFSIDPFKEPGLHLIFKDPTMHTVTKYPYFLSNDIESMIVENYGFITN